MDVGAAAQSLGLPGGTIKARWFRGREILEGKLSEEEDLLPSSGFAFLVMDALQRDSFARPSISFPSRRALPGITVAGLALLGVLFGLVMFAPAG